MMNEKRSQFPYQALGGRLRRVREKLEQSVAEVSGAVEIDANQLAEIEEGKVRPSEDILLLLISYFSLKDEEAARLWMMAGYRQDSLDDPASGSSDDIKASAMIVPIDVRVIYTDVVHMVANDFGIVMNFMQGGTGNSQPLVISRVGMSREHAQSVLELLQQTLAQSAQKSLPAPKKPKI